MSMGAVGETAIFREMENLLEIASNFLRLHIERTKSFHSRCVDEIAALG